MKTLKYNRIKGPKITTADYLQTLNNTELQDIYNSSFFYDLKLPEFMRKLQDELQRRKITTLPALF